MVIPLIRAGVKPRCVTIVPARQFILADRFEIVPAETPGGKTRLKINQRMKAEGFDRIKTCAARSMIMISPLIPRMSRAAARGRLIQLIEYVR